MKTGLWLLVVVLLSGCSGPVRPAWVDGPVQLYPQHAYFTGVGSGPDRALAEDRARAEIAKILRADVSSRQSSEEAHWLTRSGVAATESYRQAVSSEISVVSGRVLEGVRIAELWRDSQGGSYHALALLDRLATTATLRERFDALDARLVAEVARIDQATTPVAALGAALRALATQRQAREVAADLRIVDPGGFAGGTTAVSAAELVTRADRAAAAIRVAIALDNDRDGIVAAGLLAALVECGVRPAGEEAANLKLVGTVQIEEYPASGTINWSIATARLALADGAGQVSDQLAVTVREGSQSAQRAETLARELLGKRLAAALIERIGLEPAAKR
jgi:hypothetical protein